jgi:hypothetical protein
VVSKGRFRVRKLSTASEPSSGDYRAIAEDARLQNEYADRASLVGAPAVQRGRFKVRPVQLDVQANKKVHATPASVLSAVAKQNSEVMEKIASLERMMITFAAQQACIQQQQQQATSPQTALSAPADAASSPVTIDEDLHVHQLKALVDRMTSEIEHVRRKAGDMKLELRALKDKNRLLEQRLEEEKKRRVASESKLMDEREKHRAAETGRKKGSTPGGPARGPRCRANSSSVVAVSSPPSTPRDTPPVSPPPRLNLGTSSSAKMSPNAGVCDGQAIQDKATVLQEKLLRQQQLLQQQQPSPYPPQSHYPLAHQRSQSAQAITIGDDSSLVGSIPVSRNCSPAPSPTRASAAAAAALEALPLSLNCNISEQTVVNATSVPVSTRPEHVRRSSLGFVAPQGMVSGCSGVYSGHQLSGVHHGHGPSSMFFASNGSMPSPSGSPPSLNVNAAYAISQMSIATVEK